MMIFTTGPSFLSGYGHQVAFFQQDFGIEFKRKFLQILLITASIELAGVLCIFLALLWRHIPVLEALFSASFHSISAFCNAGFSIYKDNLIGLRDSPVIMTTIMSLIVLGGLGHMVVSEVWHHGKNWVCRSNPYTPLGIDWGFQAKEERRRG